MSKNIEEQNQAQAKPDHGRKYRGKPSYSFPVWNGILEHREKIGPAVWEFLWCIDKVTREDANGVGWCLGKTPIKIQTVADDLSVHKNTASANMERLAVEGYILRKRVPRGFLIGVVNSRKFSARRKSDSEKTPNHESQKTVNHRESESQETVNQSGSSESQKTVTQSEVNHSFQDGESQKTVNAKDFAVDLAIKTDTTEGLVDVAVRCSPDGSRGLGEGNIYTSPPIGEKTKIQIHPDALLTLEGYQAAYAKLNTPMWAAREAGQRQLADSLIEQLHALDDATRCPHGFKRTFQCDYCIAAITAQIVQK